jgi:hypothetical protein
VGRSEWGGSPPELVTGGAIGLGAAGGVETAGLDAPEADGAGTGAGADVDAPPAPKIGSCTRACEGSGTSCLPACGDAPEDGEGDVSRRPWRDSAEGTVPGPGVAAITGREGGSGIGGAATPGPGVRPSIVDAWEVLGGCPAGRSGTGLAGGEMSAGGGKARGARGGGGSTVRGLAGGKAGASGRPRTVLVRVSSGARIDPSRGRAAADLFSGPVSSTGGAVTPRVDEGGCVGSGTIWERPASRSADGSGASTTRFGRVGASESTEPVGRNLRDTTRATTLAPIAARTHRREASPAPTRRGHATPDSLDPSSFCSFLSVVPHPGQSRSTTRSGATHCSRWAHSVPHSGQWCRWRPTRAPRTASPGSARSQGHQAARPSTQRPWCVHSTSQKGQWCEWGGRVSRSSRPAHTAQSASETLARVPVDESNVGSRQPSALGPLCCHRWSF